MNFTKKQTAVFGAILLIAIAVFAGVYFLSASPAEAGSKTITVDTFWDDTQKTHTIQTEQAYLGQALGESSFVRGEKGGMGLYILTVDGRTADQGKQEWWCITKGGEAVNTGADSTPIADGDRFELTLKTGF